MDPEVRIDELARTAGVAATTVRLYQHRGLLPPPRLEGRVGWYGTAHLDRLRLIARLQEQGHSLAGIGRLIESWESGVGLADLVGAESPLARLLTGADAVELSPAELAQRLPVDAVTPEALAAATDAGLVELTTDGTVRVPDPRFLDVGPAVAATGIPSAAIISEWVRLRTSTDAIADQFVAVFEQHVVPDGEIANLEADEMIALARRFEQLHRLAAHVVQLAMDASLVAVARRRLPEVADALVEASTGDPASPGVKPGR